MRTQPAPGADPEPQRVVARAGRLFGDGPDPELAAEDRVDSWGDDGVDVLPDRAASDNAGRLEEDRPPHYA
ncbi:hypothetical protein F8O01_03515 [Pseudoclavibacter chungangensis]|uniref:Uncharacterized protein n=1 Tax=Pseudoclavibacter chungangensis TaxID=587635 RepID=A0A7J5C0I0_9MICO|nr:hypothetical protein [Pseudoclavibacter chungangensis]KAB1660401.1 hypothetical protein F8O01_03515 [Pseudoclavibacter chungangensis]NYJ65767.1 hypothetical protein [Pseudoclavibacter chungangensis]